MGAHVAAKGEAPRSRGHQEAVYLTEGGTVAAKRLASRDFGLVDELDAKPTRWSTLKARFAAVSFRLWPTAQDR